MTSQEIDAMSLPALYALHVRLSLIDADGAREVEDAINERIEQREAEVIEAALEEAAEFGEETGP